MIRTLAAAVFALLTVTIPARASTIEFVNLNFGNGFTASGTISFFGPVGPPPQFFVPGPDLTLDFNGAPLPSLFVDVGLGNPIKTDPVFFDACGALPCPYGPPIVEALSWPIDHIPTNFAEFTLGNSATRGDGTPAISGDVSPVPLPATLPLFGIALAGLGGFAALGRRGRA